MKSRSVTKIMCLVLGRGHGGRSVIRSSARRFRQRGNVPNGRPELPCGSFQSSQGSPIHRDSFDPRRHDLGIVFARCS